MLLRQEDAPVNQSGLPPCSLLPLAIPHACNLPAARYARTVRPIPAQAKKVENDLNLIKHNLKEQLSYFKKPVKRRRGHAQTKLSLAGGYRLALKRAMGYAATQTVLLQEGLTATSRQTLNRWECWLASNMLIQSQNWYLQHYTLLQWELEQLRSRGDATVAPGTQ